MFPVTHNSLFIVLNNIAGLSTYVLGFHLVRRFIIIVAKENI
jgi:hypothetical protein